MSSDTCTRRPTRRWLLAATACLLAGLAGCTRYPRATSKESMVLIKALYTACSSRDVRRLDRVEKAIRKEADEGKLTPEEAAAFQRIVEQARAGEWEDAASASYAFATAQVR